MRLKFPALAALVLTAAIALQSGLAPAVETAGRYLKDDRGVDELGRSATLDVKSSWGGKLDIEMVIANPALCGGAVGGPAALKGDRALLTDGDCRLALTFLGDRVEVVEQPGSQCQAEQCPYSGVYYRYGALPKPVPEMIEQIRAHFQFINNNLEQYNSTGAEMDGFSTEGGKLQGWIYMDYVKKIAVNLYGEMGRSLEEYYFFNNDLLFYFDQTTHYEAPFSDKIRAVEENRYYFYQGNLIRWLDKDRKEAAPSSPEFGAAREKILKEAGAYRRLVEDGKETIQPDDLKP